MTPSEYLAIASMLLFVAWAVGMSIGGGSKPTNRRW